MKTLNFKKKTIAVAVIILCTGTGAGVVGAVYTTMKNAKNTANPEPKNALAEFQREDEDYQKRITSFKRDQYDMPVAALSRNPKVEVCTNGIGGEIPEILPGMFDEPLYHFDAERVETELPGEYAFSPYVTSYTAVGDILFKKPLDLFDRKLVTVEQLTRNFSDLNVVIGTKAYKNSFQTMEHKSGFPQAYINQQAGSTVTLSAFNNNCMKGVAKQNITFRKVDLSGTPIYQLLSAKYYTSLHHGMNGLYNYTGSTPDFVSPQFLKWSQSNNRVYLDILKGSALFPKGSTIYIPSTFENTDETITVDFKSAPLTISKDDWLRSLAKEQGISLIDVSYIPEIFPDFVIYKAIKNSTGDRLTEVALVEKDGKIYAGTWGLPGKNSITGDEPDRNNLVLMNETALEASLVLFKAAYQGSKLDIGTENEKLDVRYEKAQSSKETKVSDQYKDLKEFFNTAPSETKTDNNLQSNTIPYK